MQEVANRVADQAPSYSKRSCAAIPSAACLDHCSMGETVSSELWTRTAGSALKARVEHDKIAQVRLSGIKDGWEFNMHGFFHAVALRSPRKSIVVSRSMCVQTSTSPLLCGRLMARLRPSATLGRNTAVAQCNLSREGRMEA
jgi:hypothetical protein